MKSILVPPTDAETTVDLSDALSGDGYSFLQVHITLRDDLGNVNDFPGSGSLAVTGKSLHAETFVPTCGGMIWLPEGFERLQTICRILEAIRFTPSALPANWTYEIAITFGR